MTVRWFVSRLADHQEGQVVLKIVTISHYSLRALATILSMVNFYCKRFHLAPPFVRFDSPRHRYKAVLFLDRMV